MSKARRKAYHRGVWAEYIAGICLFFKGYRIVAWRYKAPMGEVDLIAVRGRALVMVEVKRRKGNKGEALYAVTPRNQRRIEGASLHFLAKNPSFSQHHVRFDVFAFSSLFSFQHLDNAWQARS